MSGLKVKSTHDLRHTAATRMIETGASIIAVNKILGHADLKTTMRYAHPDDSLVEAVENLRKFDPDRSNFCSNEQEGKGEENLTH